MTYFKINNVDYSKYINALNISTTHNFNSQTNAAGDTVVDYINKKRVIEVGIIPIDDVEAMKTLTSTIDTFNMAISFINPRTNALEENVNVILPENNINYYTIQQNKVIYNGFTLKFIEL